MFGKVLIANRGEIAVRVIRACRDLGIRSVAVYSDADRDALHVRLADEACRIGPAPSSESYLDVARVLEAARATGAEAVHPGYGFLSENAEFARAVAAAGLVFVGPSAASIALMGSKLDARRVAAEAGLPVVPGSGAVRSLDEAREAARSIGYPVMLKASSGGGGKGMRRVGSAEDLGVALRETRAEAAAAFGDGAVYLEKVVERPRHVEIQVLSDRHGRAVHLGERECTIQRRHQKVVEEAPSPVVDPALREEMGSAALRLARATGYDSAGTVEFLLDGVTRDFYFLEMNTRIQVEHPVTEVVTVIDLVAAQIRISAGESLGLEQEDIRIRGAAIECRIYAEDFENGFMPAPGTIRRLRAPSGPGIREDTGVYPGWVVPLEYDPLLSKLVAWGPSREEAIGRMRRALAEYVLDGIRSNLGFFREVLLDPAFLGGDFDTGFIERWRCGRIPPVLDSGDRDLAVLAAALFRARGDAGGEAATGRPRPAEPKHEEKRGWKMAGRRRLMRGS
jgi:acetyl-CoA carboxylase biotin carboxylase subunit